MKTYYSIIFSQLNPLSNERLNVGLIMLSSDGLLNFRYSTEKLNLLKKLIPEDQVKMLTAYLKGISNRAAWKNELLEPSKEITFEYLSYLSNYTHNLVSFSKPEVLDIKMTDDIFNKLFEKWVYKKAEVEQPKSSVANWYQVREEVFERVNQRVNTRKELTPENLPFIVFPVTIDMIGRNDQPVLNQFIDFNASTQSLRMSIQNYTTLIKPFEIEEKRPGKFFIVGDEPDKKNEKQHLIWEHLRDSPLVSEKIVEIVSLDETDRVEEYLADHDVHPYFS